MMFKKISRVAYVVLLLIFGFSFSPQLQATKTAKTEKIIIVGGGHIGLVEAYLAWHKAKTNGENIIIEIFEKNPKVTDTTASNIWNSHTPDEIASVVPRGQELAQKLKIPFDQPGGIRIDDVADVNDSERTKHFIEQVEIYGQDGNGHQKRTQALLRLGKAGMELWKQFYENADDELRALLGEANFNPCSELKGDEARLHKGYRIDLIYDMPKAKNHAMTMMKSYQELGYKNCKILSPDEVVERDPSLAQFCTMHSEGEPGKREWKEDSVALWRPGGCIDTQTLLPKLADYLRRAMGTYVDKNGVERNRFQLHLNKKVIGVIYDAQTPNYVVIKSLKFEDGTQTENDAAATYVFCPGEAVGTLHNLGFSEPAYAGFAGASLSLDVQISKDQLKEFEGLNHCMEVHKVGVVLAWQARIRNGKIFLGGAGTKAYYGDKTPTLSDAFAKDRNLLQLRMFNDVLPQVVSIALKRDTKGQQLTQKDMDLLEKAGIAKRWVGRRSVAYDGFPTLGRLYHDGKIVSNARATTHLGSGGGSFAFITSLISSYSLNKKRFQGDLEKLGLRPSFVKEVLSYADSRRYAK